MTKITIQVKDGNGRAINPHENMIMNERSTSGQTINPDWYNFEQTVQSLFTFLPNGDRAPDGVYEAEVVWQFTLSGDEDDWHDTDPRAYEACGSFDAYDKNERYSQNRRIYRIIDQPEEGQMKGEKIYEYFSLQTLKRLLPVIQSETRPIKGHPDPGALIDCWRTVQDIVELLYDKGEVKRMCFRSAELAAIPHLAPNLDQIIENRGYIVNKPKDHELIQKHQPPVSSDVSAEEIWRKYCEDYEGSIMMSKSSFMIAMHEYATLKTAELSEENEKLRSVLEELSSMPTISLYHQDLKAKAFTILNPHP